MLKMDKRKRIRVDFRDFDLRDGKIGTTSLRRIEIGKAMAETGWRRGTNTGFSGWKKKTKQAGILLYYCTKYKMW